MFTREDHLAALRLQILQGRNWMKTPIAEAEYRNSAHLKEMKLRQFDVLTDLGKFLASLPPDLWAQREGPRDV